MKKSIAALSAAAVLGLGLGVSAPATAVDYPGSVPTKGDVKPPKSPTPGKPAKLKFSIDAAGNVAPTGKAIFVVKGAKGQFFKVEKYYNGGKLTVFTNSLKKGKYSVKVKFVPAPGTPFRGSTDKANLTVG